MSSGTARRMLASSKKPAPTPHPSHRLAARARSKHTAPVRQLARTASEQQAPVQAFDAAGSSLPLSGPGLFVEVYSDVFSGLPIPVASQVPAQAVSPALNYTQAYWDSYDNPGGLRPPLFHLANDSSEFTLLFYGAWSPTALNGGSLRIFSIYCRHWIPRPC